MRISGPIIVLIALASQVTNSNSLMAQESFVTTVKPEVRPIRVTTSQPVTLEAWFTADIGSRVSGIVEGVSADIGHPVSRNQVLATIAVPELRAREMVLAAEVRVAETIVDSQTAALQAVSAETDRILQLVENQSITDKAGDEARRKLHSARSDLEAARAGLDASSARLEEIREFIGFATLRAPFDGVVTHRGIDPGDHVLGDKTDRSDDALFCLMQLDKLRAVMHIPEKDIPYLDPGDPIVLTFDAIPGFKLNAKVDRMAMALDPETQRMRVEADINALNTRLHPGFYGSAEVLLHMRDQAVTVPATALRFHGGKPVIYSVENNRIVHHPVETGMNNGDWIEVISGIAGSETVVVGTVDQLPEGTEVNVR